jgi:hypothetical protein
MDEKQGFGELTAEDFEAGDIVEWSTWDQELEQWNTHYGIIVRTENRIQSNSH